jgi:hypothetical protein
VQSPKFPCKGIGKLSYSKALDFDSELPVLSPLKSILKTTPSNASDIVKVVKAWEEMLELYISIPSKMDFENFLSCTSIQVYQSELWKSKVALI